MWRGRAPPAVPTHGSWLRPLAFCLREKTHRHSTGVMTRPTCLAPLGSSLDLRTPEELQRSPTSGGRGRATKGLLDVTVCSRLGAGLSHQETGFRICKPSPGVPRNHWRRLLMKPSTCDETAGWVRAHLKHRIEQPRAVITTKKQCPGSRSGNRSRLVVHRPQDTMPVLETLLWL